MPVSAQRQHHTQSHHSVSSARPDHANAQPAPVGEPFLTQQQAWGNQSLQRLLRTRVMQAKLTVNQPGDPYEQEADRVAEQVMCQPDATLTAERSRSTSTPLVQRRGTGSGTTREAVPSIVQEVLSSPGQPLNVATRTFFEPRFGHDFSQVRIRTDAKAAESARSVNAMAYTAGSHIVFGQCAPRTMVGNSLLAHELAHVVQQTKAAEGLHAPQLSPTEADGYFSTSAVTGQATLVSGQEMIGGEQVSLRRLPEGRIQRQVLQEMGPSVAPSAHGDRPSSTHGFSQLRRDYPEFARQLADFSQRFWDFYELTQGPLILSGIHDAPYFIQARKQFNDYLDALRHQERYMDQGDRYSPRDIYNWMKLVEGILGAVQPLIDLAEPGVSNDVQETEAIRQLRSQLPKLAAELTRLQNVSVIRAESEKIEAAAQVSRDEAAAKAAHRETQEGQREAAVAYARTYVEKHWRWDLGKSSAEVHAITLGRHFVHEQQLDGPSIQAVLEALQSESPDLYDHALFHGRLLVYLLSEGVTGLDVPKLRSSPTQSEAQEAGAEERGVPFHISGADFYEGFEITWLDLSQRQPIAAPQFAYPTPRDVASFQFNFQKGVVFGFGLALKDAFWDVVSMFNPMTYIALMNFLNNQLTDGQWRYQLGQGFAEELHKYLKDVTDDSASEIGFKIGKGFGYLLAQIPLSMLGAKVATLATGALRATRWGKPLVEFGERVADAVPWRDPKIVEDEIVSDPVPRVTGGPATRAEVTSSVPGKVAAERTGSPMEELPQVTPNVMGSDPEFTTAPSDQPSRVNTVEGGGSLDVSEVRTPAPDDVPGPLVAVSASARVQVPQAAELSHSGSGLRMAASGSGSGPQGGRVNSPAERKLSENDPVEDPGAGSPREGGAEIIGSDPDFPPQQVHSGVD